MTREKEKARSRSYGGRLDLRDILRFVVGAFRETTDAARSARVGGHAVHRVACPGERRIVRGFRVRRGAVASRRFASGSTRGSRERKPRDASGERVLAIRNRTHLREDVHELALALVAPLGAEHGAHLAELVPLGLVGLRRRGRVCDGLANRGARGSHGAMRPLRLSREHGGVRAHGRDGGHDAHRSNGENVLGYVRAEPRPLRNASVRLTASLLVAGAAPIARALSGGGVFRQASAGAGEKICLRTAARSRS